MLAVRESAQGANVFVLTMHGTANQAPVEIRSSRLAA